MKGVGTLLLVACLAVPLGAQQLLAQHPGCRAGHGTGMAAMQGHMYDTSTVRSLKGKVTAIERAGMEMCPHKGVHLTLDSGGEQMSIHLGPVQLGFGINYLTSPRLSLSSFASFGLRESTSDLSISFGWRYSL